MEGMEVQSGAVMVSCKVRVDALATRGGALVYAAEPSKKVCIGAVAGSEEEHSAWWANGINFACPFLLKRMCNNHIWSLTIVHAVSCYYF